MKYCSCGSNLRYLDCCGQFHQKKSVPETPEALMRSRYAAYVEKNADYIQKTMLPPALQHFNKKSIEKGREHWMGLEVIQSYLDSDNPQVGFVEFIAKYQINGVEGAIRELSEFHQKNGKWYYIDGKQQNPIILERTDPRE